MEKESTHVEQSEVTEAYATGRKVERKMSDLTNMYRVRKVPGSGMFHFFRCQPFFLLFLHNIICLVSMVLTLKVRILELVRVVFILKWFTRTSVPDWHIPV